MFRIVYLFFCKLHISVWDFVNMKKTNEAKHEKKFIGQLKIWQLFSRYWSKKLMFRLKLQGHKEFWSVMKYFSERKWSVKISLGSQESWCYIMLVNSWVITPPHQKILKQFRHMKCELEIDQENNLKKWLLHLFYKLQMMGEFIH